MIKQRLKQMRDHHPEHHGRGRHGGGLGRRGPDFRSGRKLDAANLQLVILALLEAQPSHGYELIREIERRSDGFYVPSPGVIYPALTYLDEIGHVRADPQGSRKLYTLTPEGMTALDADRATVERTLDDLARIGSKMAAMRDVYEGRDGSAIRDDRDAGPLALARHGLKQALMRKRGCGPIEAARLADILNRATAEIEAIPSENHP